MTTSNILVFDTETTGLPSKGMNYKENYMDFPKVVSLSWWKDNRLMDFIIKPEGYVIPQKSTDIHGITMEEAEKSGADFRKVAKMFFEDCISSDRLVAHNIYFDSSTIKAHVRYIAPELSSMADEALDKFKRFDTAMKTIKLCGLKQPGSKRPKIPTLEELHFKLFGRRFDNAHQSSADVMALLSCYNKLVLDGYFR